MTCHDISICSLGYDMNPNSMVCHGTLDSIMKSLSCLSLSNAILASRAGSWDKYCTVWLCEAYCLLHLENSIDIRDLFKTKLQLYIDDNELQNINHQSLCTGAKSYFR